MPTKITDLEEEDVICHRGKLAKEHLGNVKFLDLIGLHKPVYSNASSPEKTIIIKKIFGKINGRFLKRKKDHWCQIDIRSAHEKIAQCLREKGIRGSDSESSLRASNSSIQNRGSCSGLFQNIADDCVQKPVTRGCVSRSAASAQWTKETPSSKYPHSTLSSCNNNLNNEVFHQSMMISRSEIPIHNVPMLPHSHTGYNNHHSVNGQIASTSCNTLVNGYSYQDDRCIKEYSSMDHHTFSDFVDRSDSRSDHSVQALPLPPKNVIPSVVQQYLGPLHVGGACFTSQTVTAPYATENIVNQDNIRLPQQTQKQSSYTLTQSSVPDQLRANEPLGSIDLSTIDIDLLSNLDIVSNQVLEDFSKGVVVDEEHDLLDYLT